MDEIEKLYRQRTPRSEQLQARAARTIAGGGSRATSKWSPYSLVLVGGEGLEVRDVDGNTYYDLTGNYGSLIHGHAYPPVVEAIRPHIERGTQWAAGNLPQIELAELLVERIPAMDSVRFVNSGSEAASLAINIARHFTGRPKLLIAKQGYHGSVWEFGMAARSGSHPGDPGATLAAEYGDVSSFEAVLSRHGKQIAAVFVEPVAGVGGMIEPSADFLKGVQRAANAAGALFVLDEVLTFRLGLGGAQAQMGLAPDLTMLGKIIGGGFPVGGVGGRKEIMDVFQPAHPKRYEHSGTYNANPISMLAGSVTVREITQASLDRMAGQGKRIAAAFARHSAANGVALNLYTVGSFVQFVFADEDAADEADEAKPQAAALHLAFLNHGLLVTPRGMLSLTTVMTEPQVEQICERIGLAFADLARSAKRQ